MTAPTPEQVDAVSHGEAIEALCVAMHRRV